MNNSSMTFEILLSCMNQKDFCLVSQENICSNVLICNQCGKRDVLEEIENGKRKRMICSDEKGLSRSRNLALDNAEADIILFADDDEVFVDNLETVVLEAFQSTGADIIAFDLFNYEKSFQKKIRKLHLFDTLKISSCQVACRREAIEKKKLRFDVNLGAGTLNGAGEENKFLWDAHKAGLSIFYYPFYIAHLKVQESTWFTGYDEDYFFKRGQVTSYYMGNKWAFLYAMYFIMTKHQLYKRECCFKGALCSILKGISSEKNFITG